MSTGQVMRQLPRYKCHKEVWALKIKDIKPVDPPTIAELEKILSSEATSYDTNDGVGAFITPEDDGYVEFPVSRSYMLKHNPVVGGYYVVYADGYKSYSPARAFEEGYTRIGGRQ